MPKSRSQPSVAKTPPRAPPVASEVGPAAPTSAEPLPLISLPSRFKPELFHKASSSPGQRPVALKEVDAYLAAVDASTDPLERFEHMRQLQVAVDAFVRRHAKESSPRVAALFALKQWLDGAVDLRRPLFLKAAKAEIAPTKPDATPPATLK